MSDHDTFLEVMQERVAAAAVGSCKKKARKLLERVFPPQLDFIRDPCRYKSLLCPRRAGKSYALAVYLYATCLEISNANVVFIAKTREKAKEILWDLVKQLNHDFELGATFQEVLLAGRLPNGSKFRLSGCETVADAGKYRGEAFHLVMLDECAEHTPVLLDFLIKRCIQPTLGDYRGTIVVAGTPGHVLAGPFYDATGDSSFEVKPDESGTAYCVARPFARRHEPDYAEVKFGWSFHAWTRRENTALPHLWAEALEIKRLNAWSDVNPIWIREYLGKWIADDSQLVYRYLQDRNGWEWGRRTDSNPFGLPAGHEWKYVLGCDLGSKDPFTIEVGAFSDTHPALYHVYEFVAKEVLTVTRMAEEIRKIASAIDIEYMVGDMEGLGESIQLQLLEEHGFNVVKAQKKDKRDHIDLLNSDLIEGRCFILQRSELARQMSQLCWDDTGIKEKSGQRNDACDAFAYLWRATRHHFFEIPVQGPKKGSVEWAALREQEQIEKLELREERWRNPERYADNDGDNVEIQW